MLNKLKIIVGSPIVFFLGGWAGGVINFKKDELPRKCSEVLLSEKKKINRSYRDPKLHTMQTDRLTDG